MSEVKIYQIKREYPNSENYNLGLWIPNFTDEFQLYYYDSDNNKWVLVGILGKDSRVLKISDTEPTEESVRYWVDTSQSPPVVKVKDYTGNWVEMSK